MGSIRPAIPRLTVAVLLALLASAEAGEKVALRTTGGRFLRAAADGASTRCDSGDPGVANEAAGFLVAVARGRGGVTPTPVDGVGGADAACGFAGDGEERGRRAR